MKNISVRPSRHCSSQKKRLRKPLRLPRDSVQVSNLTGSIVKIRYLNEVNKLKKTIPNWNRLFSKDAESKRAESWVRLSILGDPLSQKYAWAVPDTRALKILNYFSPLIEVGSGKGYWGSLLKESGTDIICIDKYQQEDCWTEVFRGQGFNI